MENLPQNPLRQSDPSIILTRKEVSETFEGPLPNPETLVRYKTAGPDFPERIMRMAENHNAADVVMKNRISLSNLIVPIIGQIFTLILGIGCLLAGIYLAKAGYSGAAIAAIAGGFSPMIIGAFKNLRQGRK